MTAKDMLSLYDFRGRPAEGNEGKEVYAAAKQRGVRCEEREVETSRYKGTVLLYPRWFLEEYFHKADPKDNISAFTITDDDDDLPF